jgi:hypothetical protein
MIINPLDSSSLSYMISTEYSGRVRGTNATPATVAPKASKPEESTEPQAEKTRETPQQEPLETLKTLGAQETAQIPVTVTPKTANSEAGRRAYQSAADYGASGASM